MLIITVSPITHILENALDVQVVTLLEETIAYQPIQIACTLILQEDALTAYKVSNLFKVYVKMFISVLLKSTIVWVTMVWDVLNVNNHISLGLMEIVSKSILIVRILIIWPNYVTNVKEDTYHQVHHVFCYGDLF